jgi:hypothetical protein
MADNKSNQSGTGEGNQPLKDIVDHTVAIPVTIFSEIMGGSKSGNDQSRSDKSGSSSSQKR